MPSHRILVTLALTLLAGCAEELPPDGGYYEDRIEPILVAGCVASTAGCHLASPEGTAAGNLDLTSYDSLMRRRDALPAYGPYPVGLLLLKAGEDFNVAVETLDPPDPSRPDQPFVDIVTDIRHAAGRGVGLDTRSAARIRDWIEQGHTRGGLPRELSIANSGECVQELGTVSGFDPTAEPLDRPSYDRFVAEVQPILRERCAGSGCHGAALADLHLACGDTEEQLRWNFWIALQHLADPPARSELIRRPLATRNGGTYHGGGDTFPSQDDDGYRDMLAWAEELVARNPAVIRDDAASDGFRYFANRVQPILVKKGCMHLNCHSPISIKLNLRGGSGGSFSRFARARNYALARKLLALETPDPNGSRLIQKNLFTPDTAPGAVGIVHRGGSLFEDFSGEGATNPATPDDCAAWDADTADLNEIPAYCVLVRWHEIERQDAVARGEIFDITEAVRSVIWVSRPLGVGGPEEFDTYRPGADLVIADATLAAAGDLSLGAERSLLGGCGLTQATADVRNPAVSWDGARAAFAARSSAAEPLRLYWMASDGTGCERIPGVAPAMDMENGILTHDFDPAFAPNGSLVFASTRGWLDRSDPRFDGPTRTPATMAPNSNLYVFDPSGAPIRQLTFLLNQELNPSFMVDGRAIFTMEKREPGFHHYGLRRINLDGGDYHPLMISRGSLGYERATEVAHLPNMDFVMVLSNHGVPDGAGTIGFFNRSIGPDQNDRDPSDRSFLRALSVPAPGMLGGFPGVYRSPSPLPSRRVIAACDPSTMSMGGGFDFDLCEIDPATARVRVIGGGPGTAEIEPVAVFARMQRGVLQSDGLGIDHPIVEPGHRDAVVHFNDFPMIASLMFVNTRTGRPVDLRMGGFDVLRTFPPPIGSTGFGDPGVAGNVVMDDYGQVYVDRETLGHVPLFPDGSAKMRIPAGIPILYRMTDSSGNELSFREGDVLTGPMVQREQEQYYPGERIQRSIPRRFFNAVCGGCHGSISGRELDVAVDVDVISGASINEARDADPVDLMP